MRYTVHQHPLSNPSTGEMTAEEKLELIAILNPSDVREKIGARVKALLDAMTGIVYKDDSQINELHVFKEIDKENPRTEVTALLAEG